MRKHLAAIVLGLLAAASFGGYSARLLADDQQTIDLEGPRPPTIPRGFPSAVPSDGEGWQGVGGSLQEFEKNRDDSFKQVHRKKPVQLPRGSGREAPAGKEDIDSRHDDALPSDDPADAGLKAEQKSHAHPLPNGSPAAAPAAHPASGSIHGDVQNAGPGTSKALPQGSAPDPHKKITTRTRGEPKSPQQVRPAGSKGQAPNVQKVDPHTLGEAEDPYFSPSVLDMRDAPGLLPPPTEFGTETGRPDLPVANSGPISLMGPNELGLNSYQSPNTSYKKRLLFETYGGGGPNSTETFSTSLGLRISDHILGITYERSQWLDTHTNTGKWTESYYANYCAALSFDTSWLSIQPCYSYGTGTGVFTERNPYDQVATAVEKRTVFKFYGRFVALVPVGESHIAVEGVTGYSQDPFLYGPYFQAWVKTPLLGLSVGAETYSGQRNSVCLGYAYGFLDVNP